ncbi:superoxide dismutase [Coxiella burnetii]|uniref:Superoxide dismutase [Fe] n=7 Tax=Coxiellaceae TaxID=118968 RepID=SODF_COXBU|nr:superoxide dismutase [Coxiella burnetii]NP_820689.1 superoxide dismutase [Coxiella burnetii RSA 493]P19685.1 RecName: Full=Superoxide dismutase [Fe] [Coxiella burnetii RSA 493]ABN81055.1 superoxide dismutase [Coxiella cheraxi]AAA23311.1 superoxide dismutase [Coxiella burnetii]AAO91203.1 superoxide dismutase [Coxiella burnetii RSA 493]ABS78055.1 superoxide dismutase [Coxiella burnetii Dugway 5J108-111]ABX77650.1 superoxide dismutase (fe) [Coxiella burnetii RSA 331]
MAFELPDLPYKLNALEPHISQETLEYHHGKHHRAYVNKLNKLIEGTPFEKEPLEEIIRKSDGGIFNNAAQHWNHTFYWHCMSPDGGGDPSGELASAIDKTFGSLEKFKALFTDSANNHFGSGWAWLVKDNNGKLEVLSTVNARNPMTEGKKPLMTCDVWEHAYYIDTRNDRPKYVNNFWQVVNWDFVMKNFKS